MRRFYKYQGLGNDFVVLDQMAGGSVIPTDEAVRLCDRRLGVGADGVLTIQPGTLAPFRMLVQNADGSEPEMCGNGLRCVVRYLEDSGQLDRAELAVEVGGAALQCRVEGESVSIEMGRAQLKGASLPSLSTGDGSPVELETSEGSVTGYAVSMGNPHFVLFVDGDPMAKARSRGADLEQHPSFPNRVNVSFVARPRGIAEPLRVVVWERGVGITQACGSGACAVGVSAVLAGFWSTGDPIRVELPGGTLDIQVDDDFGVTMVGPAARVFEGSGEFGDGK